MKLFLELLISYLEKMGIATIAVRAELPSNAGHITDQLIQESLWHTYYDIDRTIAYLSHTYINQRGLAKNSIQKHQKGLLLYNFYFS